MMEEDDDHVPHEDEGPELDDKRAIEIGRAQITLQPFDKKQPLMGTTWRSCFTGKVCMKDIGSAFPDFHLVDLYQRPKVRKLKEDLPNDLYLYRPKPMAYRNWIYHNMFKEKVMPPKQPGEEDDATSLGNRLLKHVLAQKCIDRDISGGRWSSSMAFIVITMASCFTGDETLCVSTLIVTFFIIIITFRLEDMPSWYRLVRPITFVPRVMYTSIVCWRLSLGTALQSLLGPIGCVVILIAIIIDFLLGDYLMFVSYRYACHYEVVRELANRVFVVKQIGGAMSDKEKGAMKLEQRVSIMGIGDPTCKLIADIEGYLVEFEAVDEKVVHLIHSEILDRLGDSEWQPICALGLDIFNAKTPNIRLLDAKTKEDNMLANLQKDHAAGSH